MDYMLCCFCSFLARCVRPGTISVYLQAVRNAYIEQGYEDPLLESWLPRRVVKGIQCCCGVDTVGPPLPITMPVPKNSVDACGQYDNRTEYDHALFKAALLLAIFGFLRCAEFTEGLLWECLQFHAGNLKILLKKSTTNHKAEGWRLLWPCSTPVLPSSRYISLLSRSRHVDAKMLLFALENGKSLIRVVFTEIA